MNFQGAAAYILLIKVLNKKTLRVKIKDFVFQQTDDNI
jgi:hypothetical protein